MYSHERDFIQILYVYDVVYNLFDISRMSINIHHSNSRFSLLFCKKQNNLYSSELQNNVHFNNNKGVIQAINFHIYILISTVTAV